MKKLCLCFLLLLLWSCKLDSPRESDVLGLTARSGLNPKAIPEDRVLLYTKTQKLFQAKFPEGRHTVLYLGSGHDIANPVWATGTHNLTMIDSNPMSQAEMGSAINKLFIEPVAIQFSQSTKASLPVLKGVVTKVSDSTPVLTVQFINAGYAAFFSSEYRKMYDVIFDKDSWIDEDINDKIYALLKEGGYWMGNHVPIIDEALAEVYDKIGLINRSATVAVTLPDGIKIPMQSFSFGFSVPRLFEKSATPKGNQSQVNFWLNLLFKCKGINNWLTDGAKVPPTLYDDLDEYLDEQFGFLASSIEPRLASLHDDAFRSEVNTALTKIRANIKTKLNSTIYSD